MAEDNTRPTDSHGKWQHLTKAGMPDLILEVSITDSLSSSDSGMIRCAVMALCTSAVCTWQLVELA
jgi:hypothetical protein